MAPQAPSSESKVQTALVQKAPTAIVLIAGKKSRMLCGAALAAMGHFDNPGLSIAGKPAPTADSKPRPRRSSPAGGGLPRHQFGIAAFAQPRVDIATDAADLEIGSRAQQLGDAARGARPDDRAVRQVGERESVAAA